MGNLFYVNRGETLLKHEISNFRNFKNKYPVYSSQTTNNGLMGYYKTYLFENAITWTTDGYAGNFNYRPEKFYSTTHNGTLTPKNYFVNFALAEMLNFVSEKYITKATIPLLTSTDVKNITFWAPKINEQTKISNLIFTLNNLITLHQCNEKLKIFKNVFSWEQCEVGNLFEITRGETLAKKFITNFKTRKNIYPVYSSQTTNNGLMGYYKTYLFENAITWTTDGCYAGNFNYRPEKFYSTNVNGVLISNNGYANYAVSEIINSVAQKYVTKTVNPKLMSNVVNQIKFFAPKIKEQIKISNFIFNLNNLITLHRRKEKT
ncbi:restriction endonuclease subunit S [Mycoplasmopsis synoviae]|uniref:restriction endonuclease subunit S n=1 Tax=Mycoplasmopsis synoviae TaxID=2109 RepID=UPI0034DADB87